MTGWTLAFDTSTHLSVVALGLGDAQPVRNVADVGRRHGSALLEQLDHVLADRGIRPSELSLIVAGTGPGSFVHRGSADILSAAYPNLAPQTDTPAALLAGHFDGDAIAGHFRLSKAKLGTAGQQVSKGRLAVDRR